MNVEEGHCAQQWPSFFWGKEARMDDRTPRPLRIIRDRNAFRPDEQSQRTPEDQSEIARRVELYRQQVETTGRISYLQEA